MEEVNKKWSLLLAKYVRKEISREEMEELERQMAASPIKKQQFEERTNPTAFINELAAMYHVDVNASWKKLQAALPFLQEPPKVPFYKKIAFKWLLTAAILIISVGFSYYGYYRSKLAIKEYSYAIMPNGNEFNLQNKKGILYAENGTIVNNTDTGVVITSVTGYITCPEENPIVIVTAPKERVELNLPDMSEVRLNASTVFTIPAGFGKKQRQVKLNGEGFFHIRSDKTNPFIVSLPNKTDVEAEGTLFNIRSYADEQTTYTLITGIIKIVSEAGTMLIAERQQVKSTGNDKLVPIEHINVDQVIAWTKNDFYFENKDILEIMDEIGKWYGFEVELNGRFQKKPTATGKFSRELKLKDLIAALEARNDIVIKPSGNKLIVTPK